MTEKAVVVKCRLTVAVTSKVQLCLLCSGNLAFVGL